jgi:Family of unknown function (DUF6304)
MLAYPATYSDKNGILATTIHNDGKTLNVTIRGVVFTGEFFDDFEPAADTLPELLAAFTLNRNSLCDCAFSLEMPISVVQNKKNIAANLSVKITLGVPASNGGIDSETLQLKLTYLNNAFIAVDKEGYFETALLNINSQLPPNTIVKCCFNCLYSDYSIYGNGLFGTMMCFRNAKEDYLKVKNKTDFEQIMDNFERQTQETYLCEEFTPRIAGTGYRG